MAFKEELTKYGGTIYAFSIMPDHFHMVIAPHRYDIRRFVARLKGAASKHLKLENLYPGAIPSPWGRNAWVVYLWSKEDMIRNIHYVEQNPIRAGLKPQRWSFVTPYLTPENI